MIYTILLFFFFLTYLSLINYYLKKNEIFIDRASITERHKLLLNIKDDKIPLSGFFYFVPIIFVILSNDNLITFFFCFALFLIGAMADIKILISPKIRLFAQFLLISFYAYLNSQILIDTRIEILNELMNFDILRILIIVFFFLVLINGYNFIDGVNNLSSINFLIVIFFLCLVSNDLNLNFYNVKIELLIISLLVFIFLNFFGKNYLGDGAIYGLSFLIGYMAINITLLDEKISPYFIANLLWYPAFENLFSIIRRSFRKKKKYLPDNDHLHQILYKYLKKKNRIKKKFLLSSVTGIIINLYLFCSSYIAYTYYDKTDILVFILMINIFLYIASYQLFKIFSK
jgi:UDP-N-acetylmuramyl pentapeptide phosphotransferase/UDP-N-acetylglucosamine-1-phosphate transferase